VLSRFTPAALSCATITAPTAIHPIMLTGIVTASQINRNDATSGTFAGTTSLSTSGLLTLGFIPTRRSSRQSP
jgi:hypothetical protein